MMMFMEHHADHTQSPVSQLPPLRPRMAAPETHQRPNQLPTLQEPVLEQAQTEGPKFDGPNVRAAIASRSRKRLGKPRDGESADSRERIFRRLTDGLDSAGDGECWIWKKSLSHGYGQLGPGKGAHRAAYILAKGPITNGMLVCHSCDNPPCINPEHLHAGTPADNVREACQRGRMHYGSRSGSAKLTEDDVSTIKGMLSRGFTLESIASKYPVTFTNIGHIRTGSTWSQIPTPDDPGPKAPPVKRYCGEESIKAILSQGQVLEIKSLLKLGYTFQCIAKEFGVTASNIYSIASGRSWAHIPEDAVGDTTEASDRLLEGGRKCKWTRLTADKAHAIRGRLLLGESVESLATEFNKSQDSIRNIKYGKSFPV